MSRIMQRLVAMQHQHGKFNKGAFPVKTQEQFILDVLADMSASLEDIQDFIDWAYAKPRDLLERCNNAPYGENPIETSEQIARLNNSVSSALADITVRTAKLMPWTWLPIANGAVAMKSLWLDRNDQSDQEPEPRNVPLDSIPHDPRRLTLASIGGETMMRGSSVMIFETSARRDDEGNRQVFLLDVANTLKASKGKPAIMALTILPMIVPAAELIVLAKSLQVISALEAEEYGVVIKSTSVEIDAPEAKYEIGLFS